MTDDAPGNSGTTPIIPGFYPDPTVCRVGEDFYLANSSFEYFPGAPLFHSRDLVTWTQVGNILDRRSQFRRGDVGPSLGIYGSTLRHHGGRFWFITTNVSDFESGQVVVHATDPAGPWSEPTFIPEAVGIDPDLCWDNDGTCYLTFKLFDVAGGRHGIYQAPVDLESGRFTEPPYPVWQGTGLPAEEGPHLYRIGDHWYILLAEGGTDRGHCVTIARGPSPRGPFEPHPHNPVLTHRNLPHPVQSTGHADLVQAPDGSWAAVYLATRPLGSPPGFHVLGRETFLARVEWDAGWPRFVEDAFHVAPTATGFVEEFRGEALDPRWVVPNGEPDALVGRHPDGGVTLSGSSDPLCVRIRDVEWTADVVVDGAGSAFVRIDERHECGLVLESGVARAIAQVGDLRHEVGSTPVADGLVTLRVRAIAAEPPASPASYPPDHIVLSVVQADRIVELARLDGRYYSTEVATGFTGRVLALYPPAGAGRVVSVSYRPDAN